MKISEVIKLIQADIDDENTDWDSPLGSAYMISFRALHQIQQIRAYAKELFLPLLPGETEE